MEIYFPLPRYFNFVYSPFMEGSKHRHRLNRSRSTDINRSTDTAYSNVAEIRTCPSTWKWNWIIFWRTCPLEFGWNVNCAGKESRLDTHPNTQIRQIRNVLWRVHNIGWLSKSIKEKQEKKHICRWTGIEVISLVALFNWIPTFWIVANRHYDGEHFDIAWVAKERPIRNFDASYSYILPHPVFKRSIVLRVKQRKSIVFF